MLEIVLISKIWGRAKSGARGLSIFTLMVNPHLGVRPISLHLKPHGTPSFCQLFSIEKSDFVVSKREHVNLPRQEANFKLRPAANCCYIIKIKTRQTTVVA